jgi:hypothetical protein
MTYADNPHALLASMMVDPSAGNIFENGDVAVILKADGSVKALSAGLDGSRLTTVPVEEWTDADHLAWEQGQKLMAVALSCANPQIMEIMQAWVNEPEVLELLKGLAIKH